MNGESARTQVRGGVGQDEGCACKICYKVGIGGEKQMTQEFHRFEIY